MTYEQWEKRIVKKIETFRFGDNKDKKIKFHTQIFQTGIISSANFYHLGLEKSETIKNALEANRAEVKANKIEEWMEPGNHPTLQIAGFKLMATEEERECLNTNAKIEAKVEGNMGIIVGFDDYGSGDTD